MKGKSIKGATRLITNALHICFDLWHATSILSGSKHNVNSTSFSSCIFVINFMFLNRIIYKW